MDGSGTEEEAEAVLTMAEDPRIAELDAKISELKEAAETMRAKKVDAHGEGQSGFETEIEELESTIQNLEIEKDALEVAAKRGGKVKAVAGAAGAVPNPWAQAAAAGANYLNERGKRKAAEKARRDAQRRRKGGFFHRAKQKYDRANDAFMKMQDDVAEGFDKHLHPWLFFIVALFLHAFDATFSFTRSSGAHFTRMFLLYALFSFWAIFFYYRTKWTEGSVKYLVVSLIALCLPLVTYIPLFGTNKYLETLLLLLPVWALFIAIDQEKAIWLKRIASFWIILIIFGLLLLVLAKVELPGFRGPTASLGSSVRGAWIDLQDAWAGLKERLASGGLFNLAAWKSRINSTFNPYAQFYTGTVEENQEPTGVFITSLESLYPITYVGTYPVLLGSIEAKTFIPGGVTISPSCRLERAGRTPLIGEVEPGGAIDVNYRLFRDVTCTFPEPNLAKGTYYGVLSVDFPYQTWSYITETFVSRRLIEQYYRQQRDINQDLGIPPTAEAVYTNGPAAIGISGERQPVDIDLDAADNQFIKQRFGFTVQDRWGQGELTTRKVTVMVPKPFALQGCSPATWSSQAAGEEYVNYTFTRSEAIDIDPRIGYNTVTCQLLLPDRAAAEQVLAFGEKVPVTFVVIAEYKYTLEKKALVRVDD